LCHAGSVTHWPYEVIRIRISENRQYNGQKKKVQKDKQRSTKHSYKTKDRVTRTPQKLRVNSGAPEGVSVPAHAGSVTHWPYVISVWQMTTDMFYL
jgi:hypothetical protein